jgi:hypothetical protein
MMRDRSELPNHEAAASQPLQCTDLKHPNFLKALTTPQPSRTKQPFLVERGRAILKPSSSRRTPAAGANSSTICLSKTMSTVSLPLLTPRAQCCFARLTIHSDSRVEKVLVLTSDSRTLVGMLLSCDQMTNLVGLSCF